MSTIRGYLSILKRHPFLGAVAGLLVGHKAASGSLFAQLLTLASFGAYSEDRARHKAAMASATEAARAAAIACAKIDPLCVGELIKSEPCLADTNAAAIKAGMAYLHRGAP